MFLMVQGKGAAFLYFLGIASFLLLSDELEVLVLDLVW
jgi:hypothetical protein